MILVGSIVCASSFGVLNALAEAPTQLLWVTVPAMVQRTLVRMHTVRIVAFLGTFLYIFVCVGWICSEIFFINFLYCKTSLQRRCHPLKGTLCVILSMSSMFDGVWLKTDAEVLKQKGWCAMSVCRRYGRWQIATGKSCVLTRRVTWTPLLFIPTATLYSYVPHKVAIRWELKA